jgi:TolB-like protein
MGKWPRLKWLLVGGLCLVVWGGCSVINSSVAPALSINATWAVLPFVNLTETPQAGRRAEAIATSLLYSMGVKSSIQFSSTQKTDPMALDSDVNVRDAALAWAKSQKVRYALTGVVDEWRYKVGVDGEPAVGVTLQVIDVETGAVIWSGVGAQTGWGREAVSAVAQKLIRHLLEQAHLYT